MMTHATVQPTRLQDRSISAAALWVQIIMFALFALAAALASAQAGGVQLETWGNTVMAGAPVTTVAANGLTGSWASTGCISALWTGSLTPLTAGPYAFNCSFANGFGLAWVDGHVLCTHGMPLYASNTGFESLQLAAGTPVSIRMQVRATSNFKGCGSDAHVSHIFVARLTMSARCRPLLPSWQVSPECQHPRRRVGVAVVGGFAVGRAGACTDPDRGAVSHATDAGTHPDGGGAARAVRQHGGLGILVQASRPLPLSAPPSPPPLSPPSHVCAQHTQTCTHARMHSHRHHVNHESDTHHHHPSSTTTHHTRRTITHHTNHHHTSPSVTIHQPANIII